MQNSDLITFITRMPKVELHVHIEATMAVATLRDIAEANGYIESLTPAHRNVLLQEHFTFSNFDDFIDKYSLCSNALRRAEDYSRIVYEYLRAAHSENIYYVEALVSPYNRMKLGVAFQDIVSGIADGRARAFKEFGIQADFVIDMGRHLLWSETHDIERARNECIRMAELAVNAREQGIIGFSIGGKENGYPVFPFVDGFEKARQGGLHIKAHTGDIDGHDDAWYTTMLLKPERLSNPIRAAQFPTLMEYLAENNIAVEFCPTGNSLISGIEAIDKHPMLEFQRHGVTVLIGSDDPSLFGTTLTNEYQRLAAELKLDAKQIKQIVMTSLDYMWVTQEEKTRYRSTFESEFQQLFSELDV